MYLDRWFSTEVWYCDQEGWNVWVVSHKDKYDDCIGESEYYHLKSDAVDMARAYLHSDRCQRMVVEKKNGEHHYTERAA